MSPVPPQLRTEDDVVRAHDQLDGIIIGHVPCPADLALQDIAMFASVLCWVLHHDHNDRFARYLRAIETELTRLGFVLEARREQ